MDVPLTVSALMRYGTSAYADREVVTCTNAERLSVIPL